ncbi:hypothetical protein JRX38_14180 [Gluconobacter cerinus]|uniref:hypothetical protein n=1 Tax=Gluconobacter cerinus TaxID=38307 RepID=UPI00193FB0B8|nr:hypothetical protein [Gluconobacter cerinus]MBM3099135.1 hypothetical protein [Gluconobacter cerinus]
MARYRVTHESFINGRLVQVGQVIDFDGVPGFNLEAVDTAAKKAKEAAGANGARDVNSQAFVQDLVKTV